MSSLYTSYYHYYLQLKRVKHLELPDEERLYALNIAWRTPVPPREQGRNGRLLELADAAGSPPRLSVHRSQSALCAFVTATGRGPDESVSQAVIAPICVS